MRGQRSAQVLALGLWIALCVGGGALIGVTTQGGDSPWYASLSKPSWTPPGWVFAPVWTTLYVAMGVAAWLVWRKGGWRQQRWPITVFLAQLTLNFAWSIIFFGLQRITWALVDIVVLWLLIIVTMRVFVRVQPAAAWLLAPYLVWVSFATVLNAAIVCRNPIESFATVPPGLTFQWPVWNSPSDTASRLVQAVSAAVSSAQ